MNNGKLMHPKRICQNKNLNKSWPWRKWKNMPFLFDTKIFSKDTSLLRPQLQAFSNNQKYTWTLQKNVHFVKECEIWKCVGLGDPTPFLLFFLCPLDLLRNIPKYNLKFATYLQSDRGGRCQGCNWVIRFWLWFWLFCMNPSVQRQTFPPSSTNNCFGKANGHGDVTSAVQEAGEGEFRRGFMGTSSRAPSSVVIKKTHRSKGGNRDSSGKSFQSGAPHAGLKPPAPVRLNVLCPAFLPWTEEGSGGSTGEVALNPGKMYHNVAWKEVAGTLHGHGL